MLDRVKCSHTEQLTPLAKRRSLLRVSISAFEDKVQFVFRMLHVKPYYTVVAKHTVLGSENVATTIKYYSMFYTKIYGKYLLVQPQHVNKIA